MIPKSESGEIFKDTGTYGYGRTESNLLKRKLLRYPRRVERCLRGIVQLLKPERHRLLTSPQRLPNW